MAAFVEHILVDMFMNKAKSFQSEISHLVVSVVSLNTVKRISHLPVPKFQNLFLETVSFLTDFFTLAAKSI